MKKSKFIFGLLGLWSILSASFSMASETGSGSSGTGQPEERAYIKSLRCSGYTTAGSVTALDIRYCHALESLVCDSNRLHAIQVGENQRLEALSCRLNQIPLEDFYRLSRYRTENGVWQLSPQRAYIDIDNDAVDLSVYGLVTVDGADNRWVLRDGAGELGPREFTREGAAFFFHEPGRKYMEITNEKVSDYVAGVPGDPVVYELVISVEKAVYRPNARVWINRFDCNGQAAGNSVQTLDVTDCVSLDTLICDHNRMTALAMGERSGIRQLVSAGNRLSLSSIHALPHPRREGVEWTFDPQEDAMSVEDGIFHLGEDAEIGGEATEIQLELDGRPAPENTYVHQDGVLRFLKRGGYTLSLYNSQVADYGPNAGPVGFTWTLDVTSAVKYQVTLAVNDAAGGRVTGGGPVEHGYETTVVAAAEDGYKFVNWTDAEGRVVSTAAEYTFAVTHDVDLTACFVKEGTEPGPGQDDPKTYAVRVQSNNEAWGTVSISGNGVYEENTRVTVTAAAKADCRFVNWTEGATVVSTSAEYTFTVTRDMTLTANFEKETANESSERQSVTVYVRDRIIFLMSASLQEEVAVYTVTGRPVYRGYAREIPMAHPGVYLVQVGAYRMKVLVR